MSHSWVWRTSASWRSLTTAATLGKGVGVVEYVGGRIELFEMDRYLIEQLLEHLQHREG